MLKKYLIFVIAIVMMAVISLKLVMEYYLASSIDLQQDVIFTLPAGTGRIAFEKQLEEKNIVNDTSKLRYILLVNPNLAKFKAGTYQLTSGMPIKSLLNLLNTGKEVQFSIRFVNGTKMQDWRKIIQQAPYLEHKLDGLTEREIALKLGITTSDRLEGWLYPDTYSYTAGTSDIDLLKRTHQRMKIELNRIWQARDKNLPYKTPYELLILASIIEKETSIDSERDKISSVFINRMRIGMKLQTDPTVIYGMNDKYTGKIARKDLTTKTPYNTYLIDGLPPTPISMPGIASIKAAAHPSITSYFYFVANGKGGHVFSTNLEQHNRAVGEYIQMMRAQRVEQGKS